MSFLLLLESQPAINSLDQLFAFRIVGCTNGSLEAFTNAAIHDANDPAIRSLQYNAQRTSSMHEVAVDSIIDGQPNIVGFPLLNGYKG